jgi:hypothetical protein
MTKINNLQVSKVIKGDSIPKDRYYLTVVV